MIFLSPLIVLFLLTNFLCQETEGVILEIVQWCRLRSRPLIIWGGRGLDFHQQYFFRGRFDQLFFSANKYCVVTLTGRAHCQRQVAFFFFDLDRAPPDD